MIKKLELLLNHERIAPSHKAEQEGDEAVNGIAFLVVTTNGSTEKPNGGLSYFTNKIASLYYKGYPKDTYLTLLRKKTFHRCPSGAYSLTLLPKNKKPTICVLKAPYWLYYSSAIYSSPPDVERIHLPFEYLPAAYKIILISSTKKRKKRVLAFIQVLQQ
ncbi:MAG: hypothetical protein AAF963_02520 [Bacteroidota bacterium]